MKTGFDAMGLDVPFSRQDNGYKAVKEMMPSVSNELAYSIVKKCSEIIRRDQPFMIVGAIESLDEDVSMLDLTGRYRLLATLLTD